MVCKEYKVQTLAEIDFSALAAMPAVVEDSLPYAEAERLISIAAWPCTMVEDDCTPTGFVMSANPQGFFISLTTVKGVSSICAKFQHLLNHSSVLAMRGIEQIVQLLKKLNAITIEVHQHINFARNDLIKPRAGRRLSQAPQ